VIDLVSKRILVTGGKGFIGSRVCELLHEAGAQATAVGRAEADLTDAAATERLFEKTTPQLVIHLAGEGGGIAAHRQNPGRHLYANATMALNVVEACRKFDVERLVTVASADAYAPDAPMPLEESDLLAGTPVAEVAGYATASRLLVSLLDGYHRQYGLGAALLVLTNVYGRGMSDDPERSFVVPAMIRRFRTALEAGDKSVVCWGSGQATRDFLFLDDAARAIVEAARCINDPSPINVGSGRETSIEELARSVAALTGYKGAIEWDEDKPEGARRRVLNVTRARELLGFQATVGLEEGLKATLTMG